ncbi:MAG: hypothetical protein BHW59_06780 [Desulfovibrio piger]|nr:MAG: hypothetical protein BHW59_06780 [Desulfovibrio piger]
MGFGGLALGDPGHYLVFPAGLEGDKRENAGKPFHEERLLSLWAPGFVMDAGKGQEVMARAVYPVWNGTGRRERLAAAGT